MIFSRAFVFTLMVSGLVAQHTLPSGRDSVDAPGLGQIAGASAFLRQQVIIDESHLGPLVGRELTELWFRRDASYRGLLQGTDADMKVSLSVTSNDANAPSDSFESNLGSTPQVVFDGTISIPTSSELNAGVADWTSENTLRIEFDTAFGYSGGTLVVDIIGQPQSGGGSPFWPIDTEYVPPRSRVQDYGSSCGIYAISSTVSETGLEIGATALFGAWGAPNSLAFLTLGIPLPTPLDLSAMGATGCFAYIQPLFSFPTVFSDDVMNSGVGGASVGIRVPANASLLGASLDSQWVNLEASLPTSMWSNAVGLTTSNATQFVIGTAAPVLGLATVTSYIPRDGDSPAATGYVETNKGPVLRFLYN